MRPAHSIGSLLLLAFALALSTLLCTRALAATDICSNSSATYPRGVCVPYDGACKGVVGTSVFVPEGSDAEIMERNAFSGIRTIRQNAGAVPPACIQFSDTFQCASNLWRCTEMNGEGVPVLPCEALCDSFWSDAFCGGTARLYYQYVLVPAGQTAKDSLFPMCAPNGYYPEDPLPPDVFGGRLIPNGIAYPAGLTGVLRYPVGTYPYVLSTGETVNVQCYNPVPASSALDVSSVCKFPLVKSGSQCVLPCPFPLYSSDEVNTILIAFLVPAVASFVLCVFVLLDSLWVIFETTRERIQKQLKRFGILARFSSRSSKSSATSPDLAGDSPNKNAHVRASPVVTRAKMAMALDKESGKPKKQRVRSSTMFALVGSVLGIVFFCVGPLPALRVGSNVSCPSRAGATININQLVNASYAERDSATGTMCRAQRVMPFILQAIFNLVLYSMFRVWTAVTRLHANDNLYRTRLTGIVLLTYCVAAPLACLIVATFTEGLSISLQPALISLAREAIICVNRFENTNVELALIFVPFIVTGVLIVALSAYIYYYLKAAQRRVAGLRAPNVQGSKKDSALQSFLFRLGVLGLFTFSVLIVLMGVTADVMVRLQQYSPSFYAWLSCDAQSQIQACVSCDGFKAQADAVRPSVAELAIQLFCMACICLLFGVFFGAQSATRLYKEYMDGSLIRKINIVWYGYDVASSFEEEASPPELATVPRKSVVAQGARPAAKSIPVLRDDNAAAAYMVSGTPPSQPNAED